MEKKDKTRTQYILDALMSGKSLLSSDIARMVSDASGEKTMIQAVDRLVIKLGNSWAFQIGHFINKKKTPQGYEYSLVPEILNLSSEEIYDLTSKTEKDRFTLEMAIEKIPRLRQYVTKAIKTAVSPVVKPAGDKKTAIKEPAKKNVTPQEKASVKKFKVKAENPVLEIEPELSDPVIYGVPVEGVFAIFLNEIERIGGLRVIFRLKVKFQKKMQA